MDTAKFRLSIVFLLFFIFFPIRGQTVSLSGRIINQNNRKPIEFARLSLFKQDSVFVKGTSADTSGIFELTGLPAGDYVLSVSCIGFETKRIQIQNLSESTGLDVFLEESAVALDEVIVSVAPVISKINQRIIFPTHQQRNHSSNGIQLLTVMMLPGLRVNSLANTVSSSDGGEIIFQINGAPVSREEIQTIKPKDIRRIEYQDYAGVRYSHSAKVINYVVRRDEKGGIVGMDLMNSLINFSGGDVIFAKFTKGKSEYALNYVIAYQDFDSNNRDREETFYFSGVPPLSKKEISEKGKFVSQIHDIMFGYNYRVNDSSFFNVKMKYGITRQPHNDFRNRLLENGIGEKRIFEGLKQHVDMPSADLYYVHALKNKQKVYINAVAGHINTDLYRNYLEYTNKDTLYMQQLQTYSDKYSLIAEGVYEKEFTLGTLKAGVKHIQSFTEQTFQQTVDLKSRLRQAESTVFSEWLYNKNSFSYGVGLRLNRVYFSNDLVSKSYYSLLPKVMIGYRWEEASFLRYDMEVSRTNPTLIQLTDIPIRIDAYLMETGNPALKPYVNWNNTIFFEKRKGLATLNLNLRHHYKHNPIMEAKKETGNVFLTVPENGKSWNKSNAEATVSIGMIKDILQFSFSGGINHFDSKGKDYRHIHTGFYYHADLSAMYKRWLLIGRLQPFDENLEGETLIKNNNYHYAAIQYNADHFSLGIGAFNPFKNVSRTIMENRNASAPFKRETYSDASRLLVVTFTWSFSFGKTSGSHEKRLNNQDTEHGVRELYK